VVAREVASSTVRFSKIGVVEDSEVLLLLLAWLLVRGAGVALGFGIAASFLTSNMLSISSRSMVVMGFEDPASRVNCFNNFSFLH
jgi:hypothetical protein